MFERRRKDMYQDFTAPWRLCEKICAKKIVVEKKQLSIRESVTEAAFIRSEMMLCYFGLFASILQALHSNPKSDHLNGPIQFFYSGDSH
jgi:hypothetical protein